MNFHISGFEDFEEKIENWVNTDEDNITSWIGQLVKHYYGVFSDEEDMTVNNLYIEEEKRLKRDTDSFIS